MQFSRSTVNLVKIVDIFLRINVTVKNFCHMGNRTHDHANNCLAHINRTVYHDMNGLAEEVHKRCVCRRTWPANIDDRDGHSY